MLFSRLYRIFMLTIELLMITKFFKLKLERKYISVKILFTYKFLLKTYVETYIRTLQLVDTLYDLQGD